MANKNQLPEQLKRFLSERNACKAEEYDCIFDRLSINNADTREVWREIESKLKNDTTAWEGLLFVIVSCTEKYNQDSIRERKSHVYISALSK